MWAFGGSNGASQGKGWQQDAPKTPRRRSKSKERKGKGKSSGKSRENNGKSGDYSGSSGQAPWQSSSLLQSMGIAPVDLAPRSPVPPKEALSDGILAGLRQHMKTLGQEVSPEVETYLLKKMGSNPQVIKQASNRLEAAQKTTVRLKAELNQLTLGWQKFTVQLEKEFDQQKEKFIEKKATLVEGIKRAEEEMVSAQDALKDAAASNGAMAAASAKEDELLLARTAENGLNTSPKRGLDEPDDPLKKKLKADVIEIEDAQPTSPGFGEAGKAV